MIPRLIHQIWVGDWPRPAWTDAWRDLPGWGYQLWDEDRIDRFGLVNRRLYDAYLADGKPWGAADIARVEILARCGGVYLDADVEFVADFGDEPFMWDDGFLVLCPNPGAETGVVNSVMGVSVGNQWIRDYQDALSDVPEDDIHPAYAKVGGVVADRVFRAGHHPGMVVLPARSFLPLTLTGQPIGQPQFGRHHYGSTRGMFGGDPL